MTDIFDYVKISMNSDGYSLVEVCNKDRKAAIKIYSDTIEELNNIKEIVTPFADDLEVKATNENSKFEPQVTVKGRGDNVVKQYLSKIQEMKNEK